MVDYVFIKLIPKANPNADGTWVKVPRQNVSGGFNQVWPAYAKFVNDDEFMAALRRGDDPPDTWETDESISS